MILATFARDEITSEAVIIAAIQEKLLKAGWQFSEHVFNDGSPQNTILRVSQRTEHQDLIHSDDAIGWGRYPRLEAWEGADEFVERWGSVPAFRAAGSPKRSRW